jgi:hypothetical protein
MCKRFDLTLPQDKVSNLQKISNQANQLQGVEYDCIHTMPSIVGALLSANR